MLSLSELARHLNLTYPRARELVDNGILVPRGGAGKMLLFDGDLKQHREALKGAQKGVAK